MKNNEQKYKEALARAKEMCVTPTDKATMEYIFPELKESEEERIKKALIKILNEIVINTNYKELGIDYNIRDMIAWLEKQGEYSWKPTEEQLEALDYAYNNCPYTERGNYYESVLADLITDLHKLHEKQNNSTLCQSEVTKASKQKLEPKFKVGDWVLNNVCFPMQIASIRDGMYIFTKGDAMSILFIDGNFHLWTIEEAKDGDVLCYKDEISLYKHDIKNCTKQETTFGGFVYYCCYDGKRFITDSLYSLTEQDKSDIHPATKEQRDTFFAKMKEAGYEWDADKKELKKIEPKTLDINKVIGQLLGNC